MKFIIPSSIIVDTPSIRGNIYKKEAIQKAIDQFNARCAKNSGIDGSFLNREHIQRVDEVTHKTKRLFINSDGVICGEIETANTKSGEQLRQDLLKDDKAVIGQITMSVPQYIYDNLVESPTTVDVVYDIIRFQVERNKEI